MKLRAAGLFLAAAAVTAPLAGAAPQGDAALKAAFIFNFAKYTEWPVLGDGAPIVACVHGDDPIGAALADTVRGQRIGRHAIDVHLAKDASAFRACHVLFIGGTDTTRLRLAIQEVALLPVLTVSDASGFARSGGIIEMFVENGRINFAINVTAAERSGVHLSARLLGLARIVRSGDVP